MVRALITGHRSASAGLWFVALALASLLAQPAIAQPGSRMCRQLEAQLASTGAGGSAQASRYDAAISRQQEQIVKARQQARQAGCGRALIGSSVSVCASLNSTLDKMQRNLLDLQRTRAKMSGGNTRQERARIQAALDVNRCRRQVPPADQPEQQGSRQRAVIDGRSGLRIGGLSGSFRTLCVRTCDGYFFPISYGVASSLFERDQNACSAMCPGTQVELHYYRVPNQESADMVSAATGLPYDQLPNAWRYREQRSSPTPRCTCNAGRSADRGFEVIGGAYAAPDGDGNVPLQAEEIPSPRVRPDPADDPETLANRDGGLNLDALRRIAKPRQPPNLSPSVPDGDRAVRVVGPMFLPDPEEAIDLQAPGPTIDR